MQEKYFGGVPLDKISERIFSLDGDTVKVDLSFDEKMGCFVRDYPNFSIHPRSTPSGRIWVKVTRDDCPFADAEYRDCGSCRFFLSERVGDMIGICTNEKTMVQAPLQEKTGD